MVDWICALPSDVFVAVMRLGVASSGAVQPGLWVLRTGTANFYVYRADDLVVAFDSGYGPATIRKELKRIGLVPEDVTHVFLTHSDFDHVGGARLFTNAQVFISRAEVPLMNGRIPRAPWLRNRPARDHITLLDDGDVVLIGSHQVVAVGCPGHTPGSTSFLVDSAWLFTGDALAIKDGRLFRPRRLYTMDASARNRSAKHLLNLGASAILTGHSGYYLDPSRQIHQP